MIKTKKRAVKKIAKTDLDENISYENYELPNDKVQGGGVTPFKIIFGIIVVLLVYFVISKFILGGPNVNTLKTKTIPEIVKMVVQDPSVQVKEITNLKEVSGVYEFEMSLDNGSGTPQKYTSYITKDGKILFQGGIKVDTLKASPQPTANAKLSCADVPKAESTQLTAFIVSNCPYGIQMQRVFKKAISEQPALSNSLIVRYIGSVENGKITAMHGEQEAAENLKQICIREEQKAKYWDYISCYMKEGKSDDCLGQTGINSTMLNSCITDPNKGLKYAQTDFDLANKYSIQSSPTLLINDKQTISESDFGGRNANAVKDIVCCASNAKADFCSKELTKDNAAVSFSVSDTSTGTNSAANCGN